MSRGLGSKQLAVLEEAFRGWVNAQLNVEDGFHGFWVRPLRQRRRGQTVGQYRSSVESERRAIRRLEALGWLGTMTSYTWVGYGEFRPPVGEPDAVEKDWVTANSSRPCVHYAMSSAERLPESAVRWPVSATDRFAEFWEDVLLPTWAAAEWPIDRAGFDQRFRLQTLDARWASARQRREALDSFMADFEAKHLWEWKQRLPGLPWRHAWARWCMREHQRVMDSRSASRGDSSVGGDVR